MPLIALTSIQPPRERASVSAARKIAVIVDGLRSCQAERLRRDDQPGEDTQISYRWRSRSGYCDFTACGAGIGFPSTRACAKSYRNSAPECIKKCSAIGPSESAGKKVSAVTMSMV